jgi:methionyl-tRNA formyltransferase
VKQSFDLIFMGTPDFAVPSLRALHRSAHRIVAVVTQPDRPKGRGRQLVSPPVKKVAREYGYECLQPHGISDPGFQETLAELEPDLFIVIALGHILPERLLKVPRLGAINIHASLLPKYRGPAPIQRAIINRESETGVTTMLMDKGMDTGDLLLSAHTRILPDDTADQLQDRLAALGADLLIQTLSELASGTLTPKPQDSTQATYAPLLKKEDGRIQWNASASSIEAFIRGVSPWPGAFTFDGDKRLKIFKAADMPMTADAAPGTVVQGFPDELRIATGEGVLAILEIQGASGKRMPIRDFLRGHPIPVGTILN